MSLKGGIKVTIMREYGLTGGGVSDLLSDRRLNYSYVPGLTCRDLLAYINSLLSWSPKSSPFSSFSRKLQFLQF